MNNDIQDNVQDVTTNPSFATEPAPDDSSVHATNPVQTAPVVTPPVTSVPETTPTPQPVEDITPPDDLPSSINSDKSPIIEEFMIEPKTEHIEAPIAPATPSEPMAQTISNPTEATITTTPPSTQEAPAPVQATTQATPITTPPVAATAPESAPASQPDNRTGFQVDTTSPLYEDPDQVKLPK